MRGIVYAIVFIIIFSQTSCIKEKFDTGKFDASLVLRSGLAIPIGYSHLGIDKYLNDTAIKEIRTSPDGFLTLYYFTSVASGTMSDLLTLNQISVDKTLLNQTGSVINVQPAGNTLDLEDSILIPVSLLQVSARIDSIDLSSGNLQISLNSANLSGTITYQFPGLQLNGAPLTVVRDISNPEVILPLSNYQIIPEHDAANNLIKCNLIIHLQSPSRPINTGSQVLSIQAGLSSLDYRIIWGDFNSFNIALPGFQFTPGIFRRMSGGHFEFTDPILKLIFSNSVGVPLALSFSQFDAVDRNNNHQTFTGTGIPTPSDPKTINYPSSSQVGVTVKDSITLNRQNSNLADLLSSGPGSINMNASANILPPETNRTSFISHGSKYEVAATLELPLWGKAEFLLLTDTLAFNYLGTLLPVPDQIERLIVHMNITNSFPVTIYPQVYLLDKNKILLDSLFTGNEKADGASDTNNDGIAEPHIQDPIDIDLPRSKIDILYKTNFLVTRGRLMTTNYPAEDVRFYSFNFLDYNIGLIAQLKAKTGKK